MSLFVSLLRLNPTMTGLESLADRDEHDWLPDPPLDRIRRYIAQALQDAAHATERVAALASLKEEPEFG